MPSESPIGNFLFSSDDGSFENIGDAQSISPSSASLFATNYTISTFAGPGRAVGNLCVSVGRHVGRTVGTVTHKAGLGHNATYERIQELCRTNWRADENSSEIILFVMSFSSANYSS